MFRRDEAEQSSRLTWKDIVDRLPPSLIVYLITGFVHLLFVFVSSIILLVSASHDCDRADDDYNDCVCDNTRYKAYSPILISASIIFEIYNVLGVWNGNLVQIMVFLLGAVFILIFSIFRCFFSTFETRFDSYALLAVSAAALIIYIMCTIFSRSYFEWIRFQEAITQQQQELLRLFNILTAVFQFSGFGAVCTLIFSLFFRDDGDALFYLDLAVIIVLLLWIAYLTLLIHSDRIQLFVFVLYAGVLLFAYLLFRSIETISNQDEHYQYLPLTTYIFLTIITVLLFICSFILTPPYYIKIRKVYADAVRYSASQN